MTQKIKKTLAEMFKGFSKFTYIERLDQLNDAEVLTKQETNYLRQGGMQDITLAEKFVENVIGYFQLPMGIATNFNIDGRDVVVPMAVEETSIIAAASKTAKWVRESGTIVTETIGLNIIGQIQFAKVQNFEKFQNIILQQKNYLIEISNREVAFGLVSRGGGVNDIQVRQIDRGDGFTMAIVHVYMNPCDAMGANVINQVCEFLKQPLEQFTGEKVTMCILSNLVDSKLTRATVTIKNIDSELAEKIEEASRFAELDPYRAATNNKGVLNGIDPILIATGNDWRAVEAGIHAYAARDGQYRSITKWRKVENTLVGVFEAPLIVGTVGGVTTLHPTAKIAMKMLDVKSANELARIAAAVGLVQNLGALKALTTVGIIEGHMKLHIKNLSLGAGATEVEMPIVVSKLEEILALRKRISLSNAVEVLRDLRNQAQH
jgi:hydroxymethylglutaryl-CoA reductase